MGSVVGGIASAVVGSALSGDGPDVEKAVETFKPFDVRSNLGSVDVRKGDIVIDPSEQIQQMLDLYAGEATQSVEDAARNLYQKQQALAQEDEDYARRTARETLFRSGRLGTYGGTRELGEVERALANARLSRELSSIETAYNMRQGAFSNYATLAPLPAMTMGPLSVNRNPVAPQVAQGMIQSELADANFRQALAAPVAQGVGEAVGGWASNAFQNIFNSGSSYFGGQPSGYYAPAYGGFSSPF